MKVCMNQVLSAAVAVGLTASIALVAACGGGGESCTENGKPIPCDQVGIQEGGTQADSTVDAPIDGAVDGGDGKATDTCSVATEHLGLFSSPPPCADSMMLTVNGDVSYACRCSGTCPCGFGCGDVPYPPPVIGFLQNVCTPGGTDDAGTLACMNVPALMVPGKATGENFQLPKVYEVKVTGAADLLLTAAVIQAHATIDLVSGCDPMSPVVTPGVPSTTDDTATLRAKIQPGGHTYARIAYDRPELSVGSETYTLTAVTLAANATCSAATTVTDGQTLMAEDASRAVDTLAAADATCGASLDRDKPLLYYKVHLMAAQKLTVAVTASSPPTELAIDILSACGATSCLATSNGVLAQPAQYTNGAAPADVIVAVGAKSIGLEAPTFDVKFTVGM
jgi:hypothetical protein